SFSVATVELTRADLLGKIRDTLAEITDNEALKLTEATSADQVTDWDSINHVKLLIALESDLGFRFETDEVSGLHNVGELIDLVQKKLS
ncbi:MAG TPA: acyl carrier protein, partial [Pseudolabrys sp.]|nr:acyl carrier protein [Pseudolabrys sp.]